MSLVLTRGKQHTLTISPSMPPEQPMPSFLDEWSGMNNVIYRGCLFLRSGGWSSHSGENATNTAGKATVCCLCVSDDRNSPETLTRTMHLSKTTILPCIAIAMDHRIMGSTDGLLIERTFIAGGDVNRYETTKQQASSMALTLKYTASADYEPIIPSATAA
jgi:hypothetical protein